MGQWILQLGGWVAVPIFDWRTFYITAKIGGGLCADVHLVNSESNWVFAYKTRQSAPRDCLIVQNCIPRSHPHNTYQVPASNQSELCTQPLMFAFSVRSYCAALWHFRLQAGWGRRVGLHIIISEQESLVMGLYFCPWGHPILSGRKPNFPTRVPHLDGLGTELADAQFIMCWDWQSFYSPFHTSSYLHSTVMMLSLIFGLLLPLLDVILGQILTNPTFCWYDGESPEVLYPLLSHSSGDHHS